MQSTTLEHATGSTDVCDRAGQRRRGGWGGQRCISYLLWKYISSVGIVPRILACASGSVSEGLKATSPTSVTCGLNSAHRETDKHK